MRPCGFPLGEPYTRQLAGKLRELRFDLGRGRMRISYYIASGRRIILLTAYNGVTVGVVCEVAEGDLKIQTLCKNPTMPVPAGIASRQIDEVKHQDLTFCGVDVPTEGVSVDDILESANDGLCAAIEAGNANLWTWKKGANNCEAALPEDGTPSPDDIALTRRVARAADLLNAEFVDHLVITTDGFASLRETGAL